MAVDISRIRKRISAGGRIGVEEAQGLCDADLYELLLAAGRLRERFKGRRIALCSIVNARSGDCSQDCKFCAQSVHYNTGAPAYSFIDPAEVKKCAEKAAALKADHFGVVTSGRGVRTGSDEERICGLIGQVPGEKIAVCASLGELTPSFARKLKNLGLRRYHHNLETSASFFPKMCSTHSYQDRIATLRIAREAGFELCCGGIFGLGESWENRLELAFTLLEEGVHSVPLNFLVPVAGTPLARNKPLPPLEILRIIAIYRFILPEKDIKVAGGRESNLRDLQSWLFFAGANGFMIGNYLTITGRPPEDDLQMIADLELEIQ